METIRHLRAGIWRRLPKPIQSVLSGADVYDGILGLLGIILLIFFGIYMYHYSNLSPAEQASTGIRVVGACGSIALALATFVTLRQNNETLEEMQMDRKRPLVVEEIRDVIQFALDRVNVDISTLDEESAGIDWQVVDGPSELTDYEGATNLINQNRPNNAAQEQFRERAPETWAKMEERNDLIDELTDVSEAILDEARPAIEEYLDNHSTHNLNKRDIDSLIGAAFKELDEWGDDAHPADVWSNHGNRLQDILESAEPEKTQRLENGERELLELSRDIREELREQKLTLRKQFGIAASEYGSDGPLEFGPK